MGFRAEGEADFRSIGSRVRRRGRGWSGRGAWSEKGERLQVTLLMRWKKGYDESVTVVTDRAPEEANVSWYFQRFWVEGEYKDHKSGGYGWEHTKMTDPKRAERLWLVMAVAMLITVLVGGLEEAQEQAAQRLHTIQQNKQKQEVRAQKREVRKRVREEREVIREQRRLWHEEVQRDREARLRRRAEQAARGGSQTQCSSLASSTILALPHVLAEPLEPP